MQVSSPRSATVAAAPTTPPIENDACFSRTTKIALAIFASLAAFVFLPLNAAIVLSAVVTIGAVLSCQESTVQPQSPITAKSPGSSSPVTPAPKDSHLAPTEICVRGDQADQSKAVTIVFSTEDARTLFMNNRQQAFAQFAWMRSINSGVRNTYPVNIVIKSDQTNQNVFSDCTIRVLKKIFGDQITTRII
jgi:hypothetical protein